MARRLVCSSFNGGAGARLSGQRSWPASSGPTGRCTSPLGCKADLRRGPARQRRLEAAGFPTLVLDGDGATAAT